MTKRVKKTSDDKDFKYTPASRQDHASSRIPPRSTRTPTGFARGELRAHRCRSRSLIPFLRGLSDTHVLGVFPVTTERCRAYLRMEMCVSMSGTLGREVGMMMTKRLLLAGGAIGLAAASSSAWWAAISHAEVFEVNHSDAEWRKRLTPISMRCCGRAEPRVPSLARCCTKDAAAFLPARAATSTCSPRPRNSIAARVGRASGRRWRDPSTRPRTPPLAWHGPRSIASAAVVISAMSSMTAPSRRAFVIV